MNNEIEFKEQLNKIKANMVMGISHWWGLKNPGYSGILVNDNKELYEYQYYFFAPRKLDEINHNHIRKVKDLNEKEYKNIINFIENEIIDKQFDNKKIFDVGYNLLINYNGINREIINNKGFGGKLKIYDKAEKLLQELLK